MSTFNDPGQGGDRLPIADLVGSLLLIDVHEQMDEMQTQFGPSTPIRADIAVLDGTSKGEVYKDALVFQRVLIGQLRGSIGAKVIGRLEMGEAKAGQNPAYRLTAATEADKAIGKRYMEYAEAQRAEVEDPF